MTNATTFGQQASTYAKGRPGYPPELYHWIAEHCSARDLVWDVGTGSGQAARELAEHFGRVHATDMSEDQIAAARPHPQISYHAAPAHQSGLADKAADAITVATALHWFADDRFWEEVRRAGRHNALFCAWTYQLPSCSPAVHAAFLDPVYAMIDPYWAEGNRICMAGYSAENLSCPFSVLTTPDFDAGGTWTAQQLVDFARSWSAHFRAREAGLDEALEKMAQAFLSAFDSTDIQFAMPISVLAARI